MRRQVACMVGCEHAWQGGMHGGECVWQGGGTCMAGACVAGETATAADGTHPTGMHSCLCYIFTHQPAYILQNIKVTTRCRATQC